MALGVSSNSDSDIEDRLEEVSGEEAKIVPAKNSRWIIFIYVGGNWDENCTF